MNQTSKLKGHRERIRERFLAGDAASRSDAALLELLLTFAIPQQDVRPLAESLIVRYGKLDHVLAAKVENLCETKGLKTNSALLLKLVDEIQNRHGSPHDERTSGADNAHKPATPGDNQRVLTPLLDSLPSARLPASPDRHRVAAPRRGTELFGKPLLKETIDMLPRLPDTIDLAQTRAFLRANLHFSAEQTRTRNTSYIVRRMFPEGMADLALRQFAKTFVNTPELSEVAYYRFCKAEPLLPKMVVELFLPSLGLGRLRRERLTEYLRSKFPESRSIRDYVHNTIDAVTAGGIASADRKQITFSVRPIRLASFAFILHSEFPEPGIYDVSKAETNRLFSSLLWTPDKILAGLYELRNAGIISKISEIDSIRQFSLKFDLPGVVSHLARDARPS